MQKLILLPETEYEELTAKIDQVNEKLDDLFSNPPQDSKCLDWLTSDEVIKLLQISRKTLQNYRDDNLIGFTRINRKIYYSKAEIEQLLRENYVKF